METIKELKKVILETGFHETGTVNIAGLQYDPEIRRICEGNVCRNYGISWACPPAIGTLEECRRRVEKYSGMLLFSGRFSIDDSFDFQGMRDGMIRFKKMVDQLDRRISEVLDSYQLLSNEGCGRCQSCTWPDAPCRFPDKLYHSIEGYGFQINQLAEQAGIQYNNGKNTVTYFGALTPISVPRGPQSRWPALLHRVLAVPFGRSTCPHRWCAANGELPI